MISCTEFIPAYSELFLFLDENYGKAEVERFWAYLFAPTGDGIPLINFVKREGIRGCFSYWAGTLNEEAADFTMYLNEKAGWFMLDMHHCPSKGRLLEMAEKEGFRPYQNYCLHCDGYRAAVEKISLRYLYNFTGIDHAACSILIYDPKVFDGRVLVDAETVVMRRKAADNPYFHKDFHSSMNMGIHYLGEHFGKQTVEAYLKQYTQKLYSDVIADYKKRGLCAITEKIRQTYENEQAPNVLSIKETASDIDVVISKCPAVTHLHQTGRQVSPWYRYTTQAVMQTLAEACKIQFYMESYDEQTGAAHYRFTKE